MLVKTAILLFSLFLSFAYAGTCSSLSRNNYSANSILTSTALNADFNQLITQVNNFDLGCGASGTLELDALNTSDFAALLNGIQQGCKVDYSSASTLSVGKCLMSINGNLVRTTTATTVAFGCGGCTAESASTKYYVYAKTDSTGTTLNLLISTTAPGTDGFDGSGNKVLAEFYNNGSSNIDQYSIDQWLVNRFVPQETGSIVASTVTINGGGGAAKGGGQEVDRWIWSRMGNKIHARMEYAQTTAGTVGSGAYTVTLPGGFLFNTTSYVHADGTDFSNANWDTGSQVGTCSVSGDSTIDGAVGIAVAASNSTVTCFFVEKDLSRQIGATNTSLAIADLSLTFNITAEIVGWD